MGKKEEKKGKSYENGAKAAKSGTIYTAHIFQLLRPALLLASTSCSLFSGLSLEITFSNSVCES